MHKRDRHDRLQVRLVDKFVNIVSLIITWYSAPVSPCQQTRLSLIIHVRHEVSGILTTLFSLNTENESVKH